MPAAQELSCPHTAQEPSCLPAGLHPFLLCSHLLASRKDLSVQGPFPQPICLPHLPSTRVSHSEINMQSPCWPIFCQRDRALAQWHGSLLPNPQLQALFLLISPPLGWVTRLGAPVTPPTGYLMTCAKWFCVSVKFLGVTFSHLITTSWSSKLLYTCSGQQREQELDVFGDWIISNPLPTPGHLVASKIKGFWPYCYF